MQAVILAGGMGTRLAEETKSQPKPMVKIGSRPILWHIMRRYALYGVEDFVICCGYKGHMVKEYFLDYHHANTDIDIHMDTGEFSCRGQEVEDWHVTLASTGLHTLTAGRVLKIRPYVGGEFFLTYGDGVGDIDIDALAECHRRSGKALTITVTKPAGRFGAVELDEATGEVHGFREKARADQFYVNAGFMMCSPRVFDFLGDGSEMLERGPFGRLVAAGEMNAYIHKGFWSPMDNTHDREYLRECVETGRAVWLKKERP